MNTSEIYSALAHLMAHRKGHFNVIPCDYLDHLRPQFPLYLVVNDEPNGWPGQHWVALYIKKPASRMEFFCSYGLGIDNYPHHFKKFAQRLKCRVIENHTRLQSSNSNVCGQFCIYFLYMKMRGCSCKFSNNRNKNDQVVKKFVKSLHFIQFFNKKHEQCCIFNYILTMVFSLLAYLEDVLVASPQTVGDPRVSFVLC